jgi:hypothetical protein
MQLTRDQQLYFRTERYAILNAIRWEVFLGLGIPLEGKTIFEPGAGIGDQTEWLLNRGAGRIYVNDGRKENMDTIRARFEGNPRLTYCFGDLETCLSGPDFQFTADMVFLWGVYYHVNDQFGKFPIMQQLAKIAPMVVFEYLACPDDSTTFYGYENVSTSLSQYAIRPTEKTMMDGLKETWGYAYLPKVQMNWEDPCAPGTPRRIAIGSRAPLDFSGISEYK